MVGLAVTVAQVLQDSPADGVHTYAEAPDAVSAVPAP